MNTENIPIDYRWGAVTVLLKSLAFPQQSGVVGLTLEAIHVLVAFFESRGRFDISNLILEENYLQAYYKMNER